MLGNEQSLDQIMNRTMMLDMSNRTWSTLSTQMLSDVDERRYLRSIHALVINHSDCLHAFTFDDDWLVLHFCYHVHNVSLYDIASHTFFSTHASHTFLSQQNRL
jgi:hypothetical protein